VIVTDWPRSITTDVGAIVTEIAVSTDTAEFVAGAAVIVGVDPPVVPVSVSVTVSTHVAVVPVGMYASAATPEFAKPGQLPDLTDHAYPKLPVPPDGVAVITTDWPWSISTVVGAIVTVGAVSTVTAVFVGGDAEPPVGPPTVPESVSVTVSTHVVVVPVGV